MECRTLRWKAASAIDRPKLTAALAHAKVSGAKLVFAKLDRLTRDVDLLRALAAVNVDLVFCDLHSVPPGATGRFLLTRMTSKSRFRLQTNRTSYAPEITRTNRTEHG